MWDESLCLSLPPSLCISFPLSLQLPLSASCLTDIVCQFPGPEAREQNRVSHFEQSLHAFTHTHTKTFDFVYHDEDFLMTILFILS